jgi:hypothetical protein
MGLCCGCSCFGGGAGGDDGGDQHARKPLGNKGTEAVKRVRKACKDVESLTALIDDRDTDIRSCWATAVKVAPIVSGKQANGIPDFNRLKNAKDWSAIVEAAAPLLDGPYMVYFAIKPDHHFIVVPIDDGHVAILQGFQGAFNIVQWLGLGQDIVFDKGEFIAAMRDLVSRNEGKKLAAALRLFSFRGVEGEITEWFEGKEVKIESCSYVEL